MNSKKLGILIATALLLLLINVMLNQINTTKLVDMQLGQYSDKENKQQEPFIKPPSSEDEYGAWVWTSPQKMSEEYLHTIVLAASENNINVLYVTIDDYLEIEALPEGEDKINKKNAYSKSVQTLVRFAREKNIEIDAEGGWRDWAEVGNTDKGFILVEYVKEYNRLYPEDKLRGFQYDVEPYLLASYERNKEAVLTRFVHFIAESTSKLGTDDIRLGVVIPHFYDDAQSWTPAVTYNGSTQHTFNHLLDILDAREGSSIILMSYRNFAEGDNGSIKISEVEVQQASKDGRRTKVIVGQETGDVSPPYVTFYGVSKAEYLAQTALVKKAFSEQSGFGGMAVHFIDPFLVLEE